MANAQDKWRVLLTDAAGSNPTVWEGDAADADEAISKARAEIDLGDVEPVADVFKLGGGSGR